MEGVRRQPRAVVAPHGGTLQRVLAGDVPLGCVGVGDGAHRHRGTIESAGFPVASAPGARIARGLLRYLELDADARPVESAERWEPRYVRNWHPSPSV